MSAYISMTPAQVAALARWVEQGPGMADVFLRYETDPRTGDARLFADQGDDRQSWDEAGTPERETLESCICGEHFDCPDGWHYGDDEPCSCTADCALTDEEE